MANGRITAKQQQILDYMKEQILKTGYPPTVREICDAVGLRSTSSVHSHLETLEKNGYIQSFYQTAENGKRRTYYQITQEGITYYQQKYNEWDLTQEVVQHFMKKIL